MGRRAISTVAAAAALLTLPGAARAATFTLDSTKDRVDVNLTDAVCADANGKCTLRAAVSEANDTPGVDQIDLKAKTYELTIPRDNTPSNLEGDLQIDEAVIVQGAGKKTTVIKQTVNDRVVLSDATPAGLLPGAIVADLTITGGRVRKTLDQMGGGIRNADNLLLLQRVVVRDNSVRPRQSINTFGGGIVQEHGRLLIRESSVRDNVVAIEDETAGSIGGGISVLDGELEIEDSKISGNVARQSGGPGRSSGGGIETRGPTTIARTSIAGNAADDGGGLMVNSLAGALELSASTVSGNRAKEGGGLRFVSDTHNSIVNSTISANTAAGQGGAAIYLRLGTVDVTQTTIARNPPAAEHTAVEVDDLISPPDTALDIERSILSNPGDECGGQLGAITTNEQSVFADASCTGGAISSDLIANPKLEDLAINPGPVPGPVTKTHALKPSSPAIDFITSGCPPPATDQRGLGRPQGTGCDAGAFELGAG